MMCERCDDLRRELREVREELAEWRRFEHLQPSQEQDERLAHWRVALGLPGRPTSLLMVLADRPDRLCRTDFLIQATREQGHPDTLALSNLIAAHLCKARTALKRHGLPYAIQSVWGLGYRMSAADAQRLKEIVGESPEQARAAA